MYLIHSRLKTGRLYWTIRVGRWSLTHNPKYGLDWFAGRDPSGWFLYVGKFGLEHRSKAQQPEDPRYSATDSPLAPNDGWRVEE